MSVFKHSVIYISFNVLQKAISFILLPIFTYFLTKDGVGKITLFNTVLPILTVYCDLALYSAGNIYTFKLKNEYEIKQLWGNITLVSSAFGVIFLAFIFMLNFYANHILLKGLDTSDCFILLIIVFFSTTFSQHQTYLQAHKYVKSFTKNGLAFTVLNVLLVIISIISLHLGYKGYFYALLLTNAIFYLRATFFAITNFIFKINFTLILKCLKYSVPLLPHITFGMCLAYIDRLFVNYYFGISELGVYGIACQFAMIFSLLLNGFISAYSPHGLRALEDKQYDKLIRYCDSFLVIFSIFIIAVSAASYDIFRVFIQHDYLGGWVVLPLFAISYMFQLGYLFFSIIIFYRKAFLINVVTIISGIINILLNFCLTHHYGIIGATISTVISYCISMFLVYYLSIRLLNVGFNFSKILRFQLFTILFILPIYIINRFLMFNNIYINVLIHIFYFITATIIILLLSRKIFSFNIFKFNMAI